MVYIPRSQTLPIELIQNIIRYIPRPTMYQCIFVCKLWSVCAIRSFYHELTVGNTQISYLNSLLYYEPRINPIKKYGSFVNKLVIKTKGDYNEAEGSLYFRKRLTKLFPKLQIIDLSACSNSKDYLYTGLTCEGRVSNLKRIKQIIVFKYPDGPVLSASKGLPNRFDSENHLVYCNLFHKSITHLDISTHDINQWTRYLKYFRKLSHLSIHGDVAFKMYYQDCEENLMSVILHDCPKLVSFKLLDSFSFCGSNGIQTSESIYLLCHMIRLKESSEFHKRIIAPMIPPPSSFNITRMESYNINLKELILVLPSIDTSKMEYIISYIPTCQLDIFELTLTRDDIHNWLNKNSAKSVVKFARHLSLARNVLFRISDLPIPVHIVERTGRDSEYEINLLCQFLEALKGSRNIRKSNTKLNLFLDQKPIDKSISFSFEITNNVDMYFEHGITYKDLISRNGNNLSSYFLMKVNDIVLTGKTTKLDIIMTKGEAGEIMQYALANFWNVDHLRIYIHNLEYPETVYNRKFIIKYERENGLTSVHGRGFSFKYNEIIRVYGGIMSDLNILTLENYLLTNGKKIKCLGNKKRSGFYYVDGKLRQNVKIRNHYELDLTCYKHLKQFRLSMPLNLNNQDLILFKFEIVGQHKKEVFFHTFMYWGNDYFQVFNDKYLKPGRRVPPLYKFVFSIKTLCKIEFSIHGEHALDE